MLRVNPNFWTRSNAYSSISKLCISSCFIHLDVVDWILEHINQERTRRGIMKKLKEMCLIVNSKVSNFCSHSLLLHFVSRLFILYRKLILILRHLIIESITFHTYVLLPVCIYIL